MRTTIQLIACVVIAWAIGWFALSVINQADRDLSLPPKPISRSIELFILWLPLTVAIAMSGNAHDPNQIGDWIGLAVQWTAIGVLLFTTVQLFDRLKSKRRLLPPNA